MTISYLEVETDLLVPDHVWPENRPPRIFGFKKHRTPFVKTGDPHAFRHTCAMNMIQSVVGIETVAMILGHESIETTHKYVVSDIEMKKATMEKIAGQDLAKMPRYKASKGLLDFLKSL